MSKCYLSNYINCYTNNNSRHFFIFRHQKQKSMIDAFLIIFMIIPTLLIWTYIFLNFVK